MSSRVGYNGVEMVINFLWDLAGPIHFPLLFNPHIRGCGRVLPTHLILRFTFVDFEMFSKLVSEFCALRPLLRGNKTCSLTAVSRHPYHQKVIDHYENPRNVGSLDKSSPTVGTGLVGAPACGDVMKLQIRVDPATNRILEARFKTFGCGSAIASSSVATEWIKGRTVEEAMSVKNQEIANELCLPPVKLHCSMLAEDAIKSAIKDYQQKQGVEKTT